MDFKNSTSIKESTGQWFVTDADRVIVGRVHTGDENGYTYYVTAKILILTPELKDPAPEGARVVVSYRLNSVPIKESNSLFQCPANTVLTGRSHQGDENGLTTYQYATLKAVDKNGHDLIANITVESVGWVDVRKESEGKGFYAPANQVILGRQHIGDENASTRYLTGIVKYNGHLTFVTDFDVSQLMRENSSSFSTNEFQVITGQCHDGDENGFTFYRVGSIFCQKQIKNTFPFDLIVRLNRNEEYAPMSASDFAKLSRFRRHNALSSDEGYNKDTKRFETTNSNALNYYGIPFDVINNYYSKQPHYRLFNLRPRDGMAVPGSISNLRVFLQPFMNLHGIPNPNNVVPSYVIKNEYNEIDNSKITLYDFWLFFGYNHVPYLQLGSHQGDWEHIMVEVKNDRIIGAWISHHTSLDFHPVPVYRAVSNLEISYLNGRQVLTVYCSEGTHALYATKEEAGLPDFTNLGYEWRITDYALTLSEQPWYLFAGGWGEVGEVKETTGPLGPWYKRFAFWCESEMSLSDVATVDDVIIVPNKYYLSSSQRENESKFEAPDNMVIAGRRHKGDENGDTCCLYASLKAVNGLGLKNPGTITFENQHWTAWVTESASNIQIPSGYVITGREHNNDENGKTRYRIAKVKFNGIDTTTILAEDKYEYQYYPESAGIFFQTEPYLIFTGRTHTGDENDLTVNYQSILKVNF